MPYQIENRAAAFTAEQFDALSPIPHLHTHLEMIYMIRGSAVASADYKDFAIEEGDIFLAFPNQIHFYHDCSSVSGYLIIFAHDQYKELKELFSSKFPVSPVIKKEQLPHDAVHILDQIVRKSHDSSRFGLVTAKGYLLALLGELLSKMTLVPNTSGYDNIKNILTYCSQKYTDRLTLDILARDLHMNKYYISRIFKERIDISFPDFVNGLRVEHACSLLETDASMTDIAFSSGFSSIRTFNRAFSKKMGMTPREYVKSREFPPPA